MAPEICWSAWARSPAMEVESEEYCVARLWNAVSEPSCAAESVGDSTDMASAEETLVSCVVSDVRRPARPTRR